MGELLDAMLPQVELRMGLPSWSTTRATALKATHIFCGRRRMVILFLLSSRPLQSLNKLSWQRICLFPGTFDPITLGHTDVIRRAVNLFDKLVIGIGVNSSKQPMFTLEQRVRLGRRNFQG